MHESFSSQKILTTSPPSRLSLTQAWEFPTLLETIINEGLATPCQRKHGSPNFCWTSDLLRENIPWNSKTKEKKCIFKRPSVIVVIAFLNLLVNDATVRRHINFFFFHNAILQSIFFSTSKMVRFISTWCFFVPAQVEQNMLVNLWNHGEGIFWA